ncbi:MAG: hypothetical protein AAGF97_09875 [Planctomycetota bacterium]
MKRTLKRLLITLTLLAVVGGLLAWAVLGYVLVRPPSYSPQVELGAVQLRPWNEHDAIYRSAQFPYVLSLTGDEGQLEYVGAKHTSDATEPQLTEIEDRWQTFQPTVALCEGRSRLSRFATRNKTGRLSESDLIRILANQHNVPLYTLEPTYEDEVAGLLQEFESQLVATYMTLRVYTAEIKQFESPSRTQQDRLALHLLRKRTNVRGLAGSMTSIADLDQYWQRAFPDAEDWRELTDIDRLSLLRQVGDLAREVRGEHMMRTIVELVQRGERVFAVVGASHVIRQEVILTECLETTPNANPVTAG